RLVSGVAGTGPACPAYPACPEVNDVVALAVGTWGAASCFAGSAVDSLVDSIAGDGATVIITSPTLATSPTLKKILATVPAKGDGSCTADLSVSTMKRI